MPDDSRRTSDESQPPPLDSEGAQRELRRVADDVLPALIARFSGGSLGELEVRHGDWRVRLRRANGAAPQAAEASGAAGPGRARESRDGRPGDGARRSDSDGARRSDSDGAHPDRSIVTSPAVGYFQPAEGLEVGHSFRTGDVLGHVDVLGIRHDVTVPVDGLLGRILVEPGEAVEYGQEVARVDALPSRQGPA